MDIVAAARFNGHILAYTSRVHGASTQLQCSKNFFIMLSSTVGVAGNNGHSNYAAGGVIQDTITRYRRSMGLPCFSTDLGAVGPIGYLASVESRNSPGRFVRMGFHMLDEDNVLEVVESGLIWPLRNLLSSQIMVGASQVWDLHSKEIAWSYDTRFTALVKFQKSAGEAN